MSFFGFDMETSDGADRHFLFAHEAKECARALAKEWCVKWAKVRDCESDLHVDSAEIGLRYCNSPLSCLAIILFRLNIILFHSAALFVHAAQIRLGGGLPLFRRF